MSAAEDPTANLPGDELATMAKAMGGPPKSAGYTAWPELAEAGWHGPAGRFAREADQYTEADPVGVLVTVLALAGAMIGRSPHFLLGNEHHGANIWPVLVGNTASRKGTALAVGTAAMSAAEPSFTGPARDGGRVLGGWGSGEALIDALKDGTDDDPGVADKRLVVVEREYARLLKVAQRDKSTLSENLRDAWDGQPLESRTRGSGTVVATGHHVVVAGHITPDELTACLSTTETMNGWANRFLWLVVRRRGRLPNGGNVPAEITGRYGRIIGDAIARTKGHGPMVRTPAADTRWAEVYNEIADDEPLGMLGAVVGRAEPQCARLSLLYALLDGASAVDTIHVDAAYALWRFSRSSAERIWGEATGDPLADRLLAALNNAGRLTGDEQHQALGRHAKALTWPEPEVCSSAPTWQRSEPRRPAGGPERSCSERSCCDAREARKAREAMPVNPFSRFTRFTRTSATETPRTPQDRTRPTMHRPMATTTTNAAPLTTT